MTNRIVALRIICLLLVSLQFTAIHAQIGKDAGAGYCSMHGNYFGASCPRCAAAGKTSTGGSESDFRLQLVQSVVPLIMDLFKKDPKKQQELLESQQRELERITIENERQRQIKEALAQELHNKLMSLYKKPPDYQQVIAKTLPGSNNGLGLKTFDGDKGDYMYKGVDVKLDPATNNTPFFGANLSPQDIQTLLDPDNDPVIVDLKNANDFIEANIKTDEVKIMSLKSSDPKGNGEPIFKKPDCIELQRKLGGFRNERENFKKTINLTQNELKEWKEKNNKALWNAAESGATFLFSKFSEHIQESRKNASNIKKWLLEFEKPMKGKGVDVDSYIKLLDTKIINYNLTKWGDNFNKSIEWASAVRDGSQSLAEHFSETEAEVAAILNNPTIKLFLNEGDSKIEATTFGISEATAKNLNKALQLVKVAGNFLTMVNPVASVGQFAIDEVYNATDWILSYKLILQQNNVHDKETQAAAYLQEKINETFELMKDCK